MIIREFQKNDQKVAEEVFALYWTDPEFLKELSRELNLYTIGTSKDKSLFLIAEENGEVTGIAGLKELPDYLRSYALTNNPVEFYVIAVKYKRKGIGRDLTLKLIERAQELGFTEILLYSPHTHSESWNFYEGSGFEKVGEITPPEDEVGQLWRKLL